ncbi:Mu transposase C-terminal domain-containing protein [Roseobacter sp. YSTF-M11]|uniref:Mu transposase C-terminal domain-containing protein n=1 Tax=Roseobacter insulae TaxID=2859783 RepID=A0A9X1K0X7_9RHOB|nr:transposase domain-containing protein [Roseobacter insulae]MBW4708659.1 Mu transposase C-terminal domain-containing protein [Roseobacter insulae]
MARLEPAQLWWTADELAASGLPLMPGTKRAINAMADRLNWRSIPDCARRKAGRGGGWQYHWSVLPSETRKALLTQKLEAEDARPDRGQAWTDFEGLKDSAKAKARMRLEAIRLIEALHGAGNSHVAATDAVARKYGVSSRTIYNWLSMIEGVAEEDRLAYLVPRQSLTARTKSVSQDVRAFMGYLQSVYLRVEQPTFRESYRDALAEARKHGWATLKPRTAQRRLERDVPRVTRVFAREGVKGLERCFPSQIRDRSGMTALEGVNADCHKIDIFVRWPDGTVNRPQIVAFQDLYSNKILSWRVDHDPNKVMVMSAFGELVERWGIPRHCLFDNGREFANKWMTAGTATRFRFKVREDDPIGVLPLMGIQVHWATPARGQSKPIERAFRDLASDLAKDPRFHGAYVGNRPDAKPENYGSRAVAAEKFLAVVAEKIDEHNARDGRLTPSANGRSFDATFEESYATAPIRRATEEQRRLWLMGQHVGKLNRDNGSLKAYGNVYHSAWMSQHPSLRVVARFDPEDLHAGIYIYDADGAFLGHAECQQEVGFFDLTEARELAAQKARIKRAEKALVDAHKPHSVTEVAERRDARAPAPSEPLEAKVVAPVFGTRRAAMPNRPPAYEAPEDPAIETEREALVLQMHGPGKRAATPSNSLGETPEERFRWARSVLARSEAGEPIGTEEARKVQQYVKSSEYTSLLDLFNTFGADGVG